MFSNIRQRCHVMKSHSKVTEMHFWMIQRANKEVFGHFRDFGLLHRLDIAYCDGTKCFSGFGNLTRSWRIIQKPLKCILNDVKRQKRGFWPFSGVLIIYSKVKNQKIRNQKIRKSENQKIENRIIEMIENQKIRKPEVESSALEHCSVLNFSWGQASICWLVRVCVCLSVS